MEDKDFLLPELKFSGRSREYDYYSDELKAKVIIEHLMNDRTHRWLDKNILGVVEGNTNGRNSANILYYLGLKANYRGIFKNYGLDEVIEIMMRSSNDYSKVIELLERFKTYNLERIIELDIESENLENGEGLEGAAKYYYGKRYERNTTNRRIAIEVHGVTCHACDFNFEEVYGERGKDFIEIHHIVPLSILEGEEKINPEIDLIPLCANCHRMIHRKKNNILSVEELKKLIADVRKKRS